MARQVAVRGINEYLRKLNREIGKVEGRTLKGLIRAGIVVVRDTERTPPLVPVDQGNLRASRFMVTNKGTTAPIGGGDFVGDDAGKLAQRHSSVISSAKGRAAGQRPTVVLGYTAFYAESVHERVGAAFRRPGAGAKWLQSALRRNERRMLDIIRKEAKV